MEDITRYSDDELSLIVFNDEYWYGQRKNTKVLEYNLRECFKFTDEQLQVLRADIATEEE
jgi:hypothetical protein